MFGPKAYIHLNRLRENYRMVKKKVGGKEIMAVVKANAYGHGALPVAKTLQQEGVKHFAVFTFNEAVELREGGLQGEILIFSRLSTDMLEDALAYDITLNLSWPDDLDLVQHFHRLHGRSPKVHLKVDTGMTRLGVPLESTEKLLKRLAADPEIRCEGLYSHFATADEGDLRYAEFQLQQFKNVLALARKLGYRFKYRHFSNSGSVLNLPQSYLDIVRCGILLYGAFPSSEVPQDIPIKPVMEWRGPIVTVRKVPKGTKVSYGGVWTASHNTQIGVIQTGFADGFPRPWYVMGSVGYGTERFPIAGRVCMDQFMVDFHDTPVKVGEEVLIFGENRQNSLRVEEICAAIETTPYVLLTAVGGRTERIYLNGDEHNR